ncbi:MAG: hypothetical protein AAGI01_07525, partial [Myxococcota bacterium]
MSNTPNPPERPDLGHVEAVVQRLAWRIRMQRALDFGITGAVFGLMGLCVVLVLYKTGWVELDTLTMAAVAALGATLLGAALGATRALDPIALAQRIDRTHGLHDRLSSALSFARGERSDADEAFIAAQLADAVLHADRVEMKRAAPMRRPADLAPLGFFVVTLGMLVMLRAPSHEHELPEAPRIEFEQVLDATALEIERDRLEELRDKLAELEDPIAEELLEELEQLLDDVEDRKISEKQFLDKLDELEEKLEESERNEALEAVTKKLMEAAKQLEQEEKKALEEIEEVKEVMEALSKKDFDRASKALEKLAKKLEDGSLSEKDLERMAKLLEKFAD